jgi:endonuclease YncB( thermonuclease family)
MWGRLAQPVPRSAHYVNTPETAFHPGLLIPNLWCILLGVAHVWSVLLLLALLCSGSAAPQAREFTRYDGCTYIPQKWNDGDSFHVRMPDGKQQVLRLYFVDTPESDHSFPERVAEQAAYFGVTAEQSLKLGKDAAGFTQRILSAGSFSVQTRWRVALGRSKLPRFRAMIVTSDGRDLNELLVGAGLARIYGTRTPLPDGRDSRTYLSHLAAAEAKAKQDRLGGWTKLA